MHLAVTLLSYVSPKPQPWHWVCKSINDTYLGYSEPSGKPLDKPESSVRLSLITIT